MKKLLLIACLFYVPKICTAQHIKLAIAQGLGWDINSKNDSLFFAKQCNSTQLKVGYHYGKLGVILNTNYIMQNNNKNLQDSRQPDNTIQANLKENATIHTINAMLGLELCIPLLQKKMHASIYACYGINSNWGGNIGYYLNNVPSVPLYYHQVKNTVGGAGQLGLSLQYRINPHIHVKWQNEMNWYKLPYDGFDNRKLLNNYEGKQAKGILISSIGLQYSFKK